MKDIPSRYDPTNEPAIYNSWEKSGAFSPTGRGEPFSMVCPPPNVTGDLHLGHALTYAVHDTIARFKRRAGYRVLIVPGADHAAIAVQTLVEKKLAAAGQRRTELGREAFLLETKKWIGYYLPRIQGQFKRLGLSCDWTRWRFTMDERSSLAVRTAFYRLYQQNLIYRGQYLVNWDPKLQTAIADDEVNHRSFAGQLYWIRYGPLTVATTRPETKLGDVALAVHPQDKRYQKYLGETLEFINERGQKQILPVVADEAVDQKFGSGVLKVTPAHDRTDQEIAQRHNLPTKTVIDRLGRIAADQGPYAGLKVAEAREKIVADLTSRGLMEKTTDHQLLQPIGERSGAVIEYLPSTEWFVKTTALKDRARRAVASGEIKFLPKHLDKIYFHWLNNLHDWCISRDLWWGHQIPAWFCLDGGSAKCQEPLVAVEEPDGCPHCYGPIQQEDKVLDTWFSAGLWPLTTLGWPAKGAEDLKTYFPTTLMETGADIIFFWVARMIMVSLALTDQVPFRTVYFHGLILDKDGQKMSKSKGNVTDPLEQIEKYGADALRMSLIGDNAPGRSQKFSQEKILKYRNFVTKIWNAYRLGALNEVKLFDQPAAANNQTAIEKAFLAKTAKFTQRYDRLITDLKLNLALEELYEFFWHEMADQFLEEQKSRLGETAPKQNLGFVLGQLLGPISDFAPFLAETIRREMFDAR
ncbi:MAG: valine--tRNA ligase [Patescibacteria group bacterium]